MILFATTRANYQFDVLKQKTSRRKFKNGREETPLNRRRTNESRTSQDTRRVELRNLRQREQITSSMSQNKKTSRRKFKNGREETPLNRRRTNESRTSQDTRRVELRNLRQREQITSSMSQNKKTSRRKFKNGREETRTLTPKAPVPKTGASTIPPLVHKKKSW